MDPLSHVVSPTGPIPPFDWSSLIAFFSLSSFFLSPSSFTHFNVVDRITFIGFIGLHSDYGAIPVQGGLFLSSRGLVGEIPEGPDPWDSLLGSPTPTEYINLL